MARSRTFTVFASWANGSGEELDVQAATAAEATAAAEAELEADYEPGWRVVDVVERSGTFFA
ncbi:hypothetical protein ACWEQ4_00800 [Rhodococcus sp. NPDC003994]